MKSKDKATLCEVTFIGPLTMTKRENFTRERAAAWVNKYGASHFPPYYGACGDLKCKKAKLMLDRGILQIDPVTLVCSVVKKATK